MPNIAGIAGVIGAGVLALFAASGASAQAERLTLGVFPGLDSAESFEVLDRYMPLAQYLQAKSGAVVMLVPVRVPGAAIRRMIEDGKSYKLFFGPPVFAAEALKKADFRSEERRRGHAGSCEGPRRRDTADDRGREELQALFRSARLRCRGPQESRFPIGRAAPWSCWFL